jgi:ribose transport system substrate-binding protein
MRVPATLVGFVLLGLAAPLIGTTGCKKTPSGSTALATGGATGALTGKTLRIAMIAKSSSNPSFLSARTGAEDRARELSTKIGAAIEIEWLTPSQEDGQVQAQRILQAVNQRVDAILISCSDDKKVSDAIDDAVARGVAVMTFDSDAPASRRFSYCGVDDFKVGEKVMAELAQVVPKAAKGLTKIAILAGNRNAPNLRRRVEGIMAEAAHHPDLKIVGTFFHVETPQDASAEMLRVQTDHPDISGWAMVGGWPLYNKTLLSDLDADAGKHPYRMVSVNALPPQLIYVERGFAPVLLAQPTYLWGSVGVETIVDKLILKKDVPTIIPMDLVRVTSANLGTWARQLKAWGFGDVPEEYLRLK